MENGRSRHPADLRRAAHPTADAHTSTRVKPSVLVSLAASATAVLAAAGVLVEGGALRQPLAVLPLIGTIALLTLGVGLAAITVSAAWQGHGTSRGVGRVPRGSDVVGQPLDQGSRRPPL